MRTWPTERTCEQQEHVGGRRPLCGCLGVAPDGISLSRAPLLTRPAAPPACWGCHSTAFPIEAAGGSKFGSFHTLPRTSRLASSLRSSTSISISAARRIVRAACICLSRSPVLALACVFRILTASDRSGMSASQLLFLPPNRLCPYFDSSTKRYADACPIAPLPLAVAAILECLSSQLAKR